MKALVLAAGFGTRLAPTTDILPKALFPVDGEPVLGRMIRQLKRAGCAALAVNTHHLADQIRAYVQHSDFGIPVHLSHEPEILGTGGAIRRLEPFWGRDPFLVVNADLVTDIDLAAAYRHHLGKKAQATLVMHYREPFNQVWVDEMDHITGFARFADAIDHSGHRQMAFTGIHVIDPAVVDRIPGAGFSDIISVYRQMIADGLTLHALVVRGHYWQDMGSPERYRDVVVDAMASDVFASVFAGAPAGPVVRERLCGDGSDRNWYRLTCGDNRMVMADHGITPILAGSELRAFVSTGEHLFRCGLPVPRIYAHDDFSGIVFLEDLGDTHLQQVVEQAPDDTVVEGYYRQVIDVWTELTALAAKTFDPAWTCQTRNYDVPLILEKECRYFVDAFLNGHLNMGIEYRELAEEFGRLAEATIAAGVQGLIHRDFQSRNIMISADRPFLIDFQGARHGPVQYDLAALLIDPYVNLTQDLRQRLLTYAMDRATRSFDCSSETFIRGYRHCVITRNLQMLGAFGHLTHAKGKPGFAQWIPHAAGMLAGHISTIGRQHYPRLSAIAERIGGAGPQAADGI